VILQGATTGFEPWTEREDQVLHKVYESKGYKRACRALPHRTAGAVFHRAQRLGLKARRRWTSADDAQLRDLWESGIRLAAIAERLERTPITTYWRAQQLGLELGCPPGYEYLSHAAARTGYTATQLRPILRWAGVTIQVAHARPTKARHRRHVVEPEAVDDAIAAWHRTEPLESAARRLGVCGATLRRWLRAIGVVDEGRDRKCHWRVRTEDVERAAAAWRARL
jgi:hypothetical protein